MDAYVSENGRTGEIMLKITDSAMKHVAASSLPRGGILFLCQSAGSLRVNCDGIEKIISDGDCFICRLQKKYAFSYDPSENSKTVYAVADGKFVYMLCEMYGISEGSVIKAPEAAEAAVQICRIMNDPKLDEPEKTEDAAIALHRFVYKVRRATRFAGKERENTAAAIKAYIDSHLEGKLTLEELSKLFFVSKTQIFRLFRDAYGIAPMQYFLQQKIELSKQMLEKTELHVSEIAESLSFTDAKHFSKTFKKFTGQLPRNYRREAKAKKLKSDV